MNFFFGAVGGIWIPLALVWCSQASEALSQKSRFLAQDQLVGLRKKNFIYNLLKIESFLLKTFFCRIPPSITLFYARRHENRQFGHFSIFIT